MLAAVYTSHLIVERQDALQRVSRYNIAWLASQAVSELARLKERVAGHAMADGTVDREEVQLRLDILANRVGLLQGSGVADLAKSRPELGDVVASLDAVIEAAGPLVANLAGKSHRELLDLLSPLEPRLARLAAAANIQGGDRVAEDQRQLSRLHWIFSGILVALAACGLVLLALLLLHNRLLRRTHGELHTQNARFDAALNNMSQALCMVDAERRLIVCNRRYVELFTLPPSLAAPRTPVSDILHALAAKGHGVGELAHAIHEAQETLIRNNLPGAFVRERSDGGLSVSVSHRPMPDGGWVATYEDITERRRAEAQIAYMAHHDALSGLPNRILFRDRLEQELRRLESQGGWLAVLCLDLDNFKNVNDTLGHPAGDLLLQVVAQRLRGCVRDGEMVARLSGDEFAVLQPTPDQPLAAQALAERLVRALSAPYEIDGHRVVISASVGAALAPADGHDADDLLKKADVALYRAKADGRSCSRFFAPEMEAQLQARLAMEADLRDVLEKRQLELFYQPLFDLQEGRIRGFEALLRWRHPERGLVPPDQFIPVAETTGLIVPIGEWVLQQACADAAGWPSDLKVAVNLSPLQFTSPQLSTAVSNALVTTGLAANRLELEVTESVLLQDSGVVLALLHELRGMGLQIALDDFGTGYSSLSYLRSFPFDKLKIDQSFVRGLTGGAGGVAIVDAIVALASSLGMTTTAEGVETIEQLDQIRRAGCTMAQGYYLGRPRPAANVLADLKSTRCPILA
ncbi:putative bifunctional diguanylate cyclase/phosphodiesterase [Dankookia rubra]|uniref:putative bifunctional diguanylate cyclase/phosphodiesterase n=1 Tax=Dankookia rubra TaxID=1442381 RepID=UPI00140CFA8A|nr:EAL domain-containing protein [Dankookia rubra]